MSLSLYSNDGPTEQGIKETQEGIHEGQKASSKPMEETRTAAITILDQPLEFIELPTLKVARLPLGPTQSHIDGLVEAGKLDIGNIFDTKEKWKNAEINREVPQVFGYTITNDTELARVITDKEELEVARKEVEASGTFPTIYVLNHEARLAHAAYLGGRVPTQEEQQSIWNKLPGANVLEKATGEGIPFPGYFNAGDREFFSIGEWVCLMSSENVGGYFKSLSLSRDDREANESWDNCEHGLSSLVVFG